MVGCPDVCGAWRGRRGGAAGRAAAAGGGDCARRGRHGDHLSGRSRGAGPDGAGARANHHTRDALRARAVIHLRESIRLERPVEEVFRYWRQLENLPRFMRHVEQVSETAAGMSHWVAPRTGRLRVEWDAEIINEVPNRLIGWRSVPGSDLTSAGSVQFAKARNGQSTQITVHMQYAPPAGRQARSWRRCSGSRPRPRCARTCGDSSSFWRQESMRRPRVPNPRRLSEGSPLLRQGGRAGGTRTGSDDPQSARRHREGDHHGHLRIRSAHLRRLHPDDAAGRHPGPRVHGRSGGRGRGITGAAGRRPSGSAVHHRLRALLLLQGITVVALRQFQPQRVDGREAQWLLGLWAVWLLTHVRRLRRAGKRSTCECRSRTWGRFRSRTR